MYSQEQKQQFLNNFIQRVNGKGQAFDTIEHNCRYVFPDHPGCAIGCQPQFEPFKNELKDSTRRFAILLTGSGTEDIAEQINLAERLKQAFNIEADDDIYFLSSLQNLHDEQFNWKGKQLKRERVEHFCKRYKLTLPESQYAEIE